MEFTFKNIDKGYIKWKYEPVGDIQPKYWFYKTTPEGDKKTVLVKRQHSTKVSGQPQRSRMYNHFGEYFGYLLADKAGVDACPVELVTLHDTKNKYAKTKRLYTACASENVKKLDESIYAGEIIISKFTARNPKRAKEILENNESQLDYSNLVPGYMGARAIDDNVDIMLASVVFETIDYEEKMGISPEQIKVDVDSNLRKAIEMIVYDCVFGNSDRHSQNWSMIYNSNLGTVKMYPNYDNEAVLGLREPEFDIKNAVTSRQGMSEFGERKLFSRMGISPMNSAVSYKSMLQHIVNKYPNYAVPTIKKITDAVTEKDVEELYNAADGITVRGTDTTELTPEHELPIQYKIFGTNLYRERRAYARDLVRHYEERGSTEKKGKDKELAFA